MNCKNPQFQSTDVQEKVNKTVKRKKYSDHIFHRILFVLERVIAVITLVALIGASTVEVWHIFALGTEYFADVSHMLHNLLSIVIGLEFVRMLIDNTPANVLEVLTMAITRHVILSHEDPWSNLACIACIAGLFAVRRYLVRQEELQEEMVEIE